MGQTTANLRNGHVTVCVSSDLMRAEVDLFPPGKDRVLMDLPAVLSDLNTAGVLWGIDEDLLEQSLWRCLSEKAPVRGVVVASGQKAVKNVPSYWHLKKRLLGPSRGDLDALSLDYREQSPYILVKKGEPLAKRIPAAPGTPGKNVAGEMLPVTNKDVVLFRPGENVLEKDGILYAACHGRFDVHDRIMSVNDTLEVPGNVDYSTGHIAFPGDVIIHGAVCDGFQVASGKSIFVKQTMDASKVLSRGDLVVEGGIKGRNTAYVHVEGSVSAKFVENVTIEARSGIRVKKSVMHSRLYSLGRVDLGEAGVLVGGALWAYDGLQVGSIGRPESPAARFLLDRITPSTASWRALLPRLSV